MINKIIFSVSTVLLFFAYGYTQSAEFNVRPEKQFKTDELSSFQLKGFEQKAIQMIVSLEEYQELCLNNDVDTVLKQQALNAQLKSFLKNAHVKCDSSTVKPEIYLDNILNGNSPCIIKYKNAKPEVTKLRGNKYQLVLDIQRHSNKNSLEEIKTIFLLERQSKMFGNRKENIWQLKIVAIE